MSRWGILNFIRNISLFQPAWTAARTWEIGEDSVKRKKKKIIEVIERLP